ncbi:hypothetical protein POM88_031161 [Heracleum sosnowskyi]|uniref:Uncharacterized protein n=1 Tax=Heracleum sosnowskyi TaxID=360622 RepID=A0AAD8HYY2_9APIA|nr:hypothetical protein POM88_031161 [Heracleum sosnowskyi]
MAAFDLPKDVSIVMDGLKDPSMDLLAWVLEHVTSDGTGTITILQVLPWLNIPLSNKKWSEDVMMNIHNLCRNYGVIPQVLTLMGHPLRLVVVERIACLHPTLLAFDRHHDKNKIKFYAERVRCNIVAMNDHGEIEMIKVVPRTNTNADFNFTEHE